MGLIIISQIQTSKKYILCGRLQLELQLRNLSTKTGMLAPNQFLLFLDPLPFATGEKN